MRSPAFLRDEIERKAYADLLACWNRLVPFVGAGFSAPACPMWGCFLASYRDAMAKDYLLPDDHELFEKLAAIPDYEGMATLLFDATRGLAQEKELNRQFGMPVPAALGSKFNFFHRAFPGLKITTNFDRLIEDSAPENLDVILGNQPGRLTTALDTNADRGLLKIHGGLNDANAIILSADQYRTAYGHDTRYDPNQPLPKLLRRIYTNHSLLFIGCSLAEDRTLMVLEDLTDRRQHFALLMRKDDERERVLFNRGLSRRHIQPIWLDDYSDIERVLADLAGKEFKGSNGIFVGRERELKQLRDGLTPLEKSINALNRPWFIIDPATKKKFGKFAQVDMLPIGTYREFGEYIEIAIQVFDVENAAQVASAEDTIPKTKDVIAQLGNKVSDTMTGPDRPIIPTEVVSTVNYNGIYFRLKEARMNGKILTCTIEAISPEKDEPVYVVSDTSLVNLGGVIYEQKGQRAFGNSSRDIEGTLVMGVPTFFEIHFKNLVVSDKKIALLDFRFKINKVESYV